MAIAYDHGRDADIAYSYSGERVVFFDFARIANVRDTCCVMENLKNGRIFSSKYESKMKMFPRPHIVVFSNHDVPDGAFSYDRVDRRLLVDEQLLKWG